MRAMVSTLRDRNFSDDEIAVSFAKEHYKLRQDPEEFKVTWIFAFGEKVMFSLVVIATIGYGNVVPISTWGKATVIIYIFIGRPLQLIMVRLLGLKLRSALRQVLEKGQEFNRKYLPDVLHFSKFMVLLSGALFFTALSLTFIFGPAAIFGRFENWSYEEGVYFSFLSLATVGLGDYIAGLSSKRHDSSLYHVYVVLIFFWLILGLAFIHMVTDLMSYLYGQIILDKLDCKCQKRVYARQKLSTVYILVADLEWNLAKFCPSEFAKEQVFRNFLILCVDHPDRITHDTLLQLFEATEDMRLIASDMLLELNVSELKGDQSFVRIPGTSAQSKESPKMPLSSPSRILLEHQSDDILKDKERITFNQAGNVKQTMDKMDSSELQASSQENAVESDIPRAPIGTTEQELLSKYDLQEKCNSQQKKTA